MTEIGPLAIEALDQPGGMYVLETECIAEIIDPRTGHPVDYGAEGELVVTNLSRTGSPLIRYRTGDRVCAGVPPEPEAPDAAGINVHPQILDVRRHLLFLSGGILGRIDDMLTIRGNNLYPAALEDVIRQFEGVVEFRIVLATVKGMQHLRIEIEPAAQLDPSKVAALTGQISETIKARWHFHADVIPVAPDSLPRFEMKARRFVREPL
jgi:phenylacetate-CoA ligase